MFYDPSLAPNINEIFLNEQESRHAIKVLRHEEGDYIELTDGRGNYYQGLITKKGKRQCKVSLTGVKAMNFPNPSLHLTIAPLKNRNRLEWIVEKATELGVSSFAFIHTHNTERTRINEDRIERIVISALKQSLRTHKPTCTYWPDFSKWLQQADLPDHNLLMTDCETPEKPFLSQVCTPGKPVSLIFGPEGDLSSEEIEEGKAAGYQPVSLGDLRLRTETAVITGLAMVHGVNQMNEQDFKNYA